MIKVNYGKKTDPGFELVLSKDLIAVRTRSKRSLLHTRSPVPSFYSSELENCELVAEYPEAGIEVYRISTGKGKSTISHLKSTLRMSPDVQFVGSVLLDPKTKEPVLYTENIFVKFDNKLEPEECEERIRQAGLTIKQHVTYATNAYFCQAPDGIGQEVFTIANELLRSDDVEYCHPELIRPRATKGIFPEQWHLKKTSIGGLEINAHANVEKAHQSSLGQGITIAIIDDGVDIDHPEFSGTNKIVAPRDVTKQSSDPRPKDPSRQNPDDHGTACAGVACANGIDGASGVAPNAKLMPIRLADGLGSHREAEAFDWAVNHGADVISCSGGPPDGDWWDPTDDGSFDSSFRLPSHTRLAIENAVTNGRNGLGCVVLFAAGNGNESMNTDEYASNPKVIAVAACNDRGTRSVYSDFGNAVWCSFPSSDFEWTQGGHSAPFTVGIWTTDRLGSKGYNEGRSQLGDPAGSYTNRFGGTSSSTPGVAGVVALMLAVNPNLTASGIRELLKKSCDKIDVGNGAYDAHGHSKFYGYGRINAATAVDLAKPQPTNAITFNRQLDAILPDLQKVEFALQVSESQPIESLAVHLDLQHSFVGDLVISITHLRRPEWDRSFYTNEAGPQMDFCGGVLMLQIRQRSKDSQANIVTGNGNSWLKIKPLKTQE